MLNRESVHLTTQQRLEVKAMRDIRHQNLASFVGACCDSPNVCILMESAPKVCVVGWIRMCWEGGGVGLYQGSGTLCD